MNIEVDPTKTGLLLNSWANAMEIFRKDYDVFAISKVQSLDAAVLAKRCFEDSLGFDAFNPVSNERLAGHIFELEGPDSIDGFKHLVNALSSSPKSGHGLRSLAAPLLLIENLDKGSVQVRRIRDGIRQLTGKGKRALRKAHDDAVDTYRSLDNQLRRIERTGFPPSPDMYATVNRAKWIVDLYRAGL